MGILLLTSVGRSAIKFLERECKTQRVIVLTLGQVQMSEESLHLVHHVIINHLIAVLLHVWGHTIVNAK